MPRTKLTAPDELGVLIKTYCFRRNTDLKQLAKSIGVCRATIYDRMAHTDSFTVGELRKIRRSLQIPAEEMRAVL